MSEPEVRYETKAMSLNEKLSAIMKEIGVIPKTKKQGGPVYAFRSIDDIMNVCNPVFSKYGVTLNNKILNHGMEAFEIEKFYKGVSEGKKQGCRAWVHLQLIFSDGILTEVTEEVAMSEDYSDKAYTQAMTMAFKSALTRKFFIPTEDMSDPDGKQEVEHNKESPIIKQTTNTVTQPKPAEAHKEKKKLMVMDGNSFSKPWMNTVDALKIGKVTIEQVKAIYTVTPEVEERLKTYLPKP